MSTFQPLHTYLILQSSDGCSPLYSFRFFKLSNFNYTLFLTLGVHSLHTTKHNSVKTITYGKLFIGHGRPLVTQIKNENYFVPSYDHNSD